MSLDQNLFTLNVTPNAADPDVVDLVDPVGTVHYRKRRVQGETYAIEVSDPLSGSVLATATAPHATSKHKTLQLHNPDAIVELKYTGTLTFKWGFKWEDHEFEWRREECFILRKPDPAVLVAVTKEPSGRLKTSSVQILDYNLNRFDIDDRKGLEILILTALLTFQDSNDAYHNPRPEDAAAASTNSASKPLSTLLNIGTRRESNASSSRAPTPTPPVVPPRPPPRVGIERIAELHMLRTLQGEGEANELEVGDEGEAEDWAQFAQRLLQDEAMLFITVRSASAASVPKVLRVVEETKRLRYKSGIEEELHQYVSYDADKPRGKGPRRINLDDPDPKGKNRSKDGYKPPESLLVHLSKIDMPELRPRPEVKDPGPELGWVPEGTKPPMPAPTSSTNPFAGKGKGRGKEEKRPEKVQRKTEKHSTTLHPEPNKLTRPASTYHARTPSYLPHPYQPSPSPSQLNNPGIYAGVPPPNYNRPQNTQSGSILSPWLRR